MTDEQRKDLTRAVNNYATYSVNEELAHRERVCVDTLRHVRKRRQDALETVIRCVESLMQESQKP